MAVSSSENLGMNQEIHRESTSSSPLLVPIQQESRPTPEDNMTRDLNGFSVAAPLMQQSAVSTSPSKPGTAEEQFLNVVDRIEDDWDEHTYEELVPLDIKLAIEENVFGWSHITSDILGHVLFTVGAFAGVFVLCLMIDRSYVWLRWIASIIAGWSSFRMVRRRRQIWLRAPYGSQKYRLDGARRLQDVQEADRSTWLGRIRRQRQQRKVERQLKRAETSFTEHHERQLHRALSSTSPNPRGQRRRPSFSIEPLNSMQSIQQDQITFSNGRIEKVFYSHGSFFGAAPFMLANPHWISILRLLMPDVYVEISRRVRAPPYKLIHWAENNPVVAAYGSAQELENNNALTNLEWDVFLNPVLVNGVCVVLQEREKYIHSVSEKLNCMVLRPFEPSQDLVSGMSPAQRDILRYYNSQLRKRVRLLVDEMLIAHGNVTQLALEQVGILKLYNYSRVRRTRRTLGGGIYAKQWMAVYAESLRLGVLDENPMNTTNHQLDRTLDEMAMSSWPDTSIAESVAIIKRITKKDDPFGLVVDVKSRHVPKQVWACVVDMLREDGVLVEGVGAFAIVDLRGLGAYTVKPVKEILFFHSAGDMQRACHDGRIQNGDSVLFNGGSLLWSRTQFGLDLLGACDPRSIRHKYRLLPFTISRSGEPVSMITSSSTLEQYKIHFGLSIGLYVQEYAIDETAAEILVDHVNRNSAIYDLGLCWGGVNGITVRGIQPDRFTSTDGYWNQRYVGLDWDPTLFPPAQGTDQNASGVYASID